MAKHRRFLKDLEDRKTKEKEDYIMSAIDQENKVKKFKDASANQRKKVQELKHEDVDDLQMEAAQPEEPPKSVGRLTEQNLHKVEKDS